MNSADVWAHLDALAKPRRSLGKLEELAVTPACAAGAPVTVLVIVFALG